MRLNSISLPFYLLVTFLGQAQAQSPAEALLAALPTCAGTCVMSLLPTSTCAPTDFACICADAPVVGAISNCYMGSCPVTDALFSANVTQSACGVKPRDKGMTLVVVNYVFVLLAATFYLVRLYVRPPTSAEFGIDDIVIAVAMAAGVVLSGLNIEMAQNLGLGTDIWAVPHRNIDRSLMFYYICESLYVLSTVLTKLTILIFYLRIFVQSSMKMAVYIAMGFCTAEGLAFCLTFTFQCTPVTYFWRSWRAPGEGTCINSNAAVWAAAAVNITMDLVVIALPIPFVLNLQTSMRRKLLVLLMFCVGLFVTIVSIIRLRSLVTFSKDPNRTYNEADTAMWSIIEVHVSVICACMPTARLMLQKMMPRVFASTADKYSRQSAGYYVQKLSNKRSSQYQSSSETSNFHGIVKTINVDVSQPVEGDEIELVNKTACNQWPSADRSYPSAWKKDPESP